MKWAFEIRKLIFNTILVIYYQVIIIYKMSTTPPTCLNSTCPSHTRQYGMLCNYRSGNYDYAPNPNNTCLRYVNQFEEPIYDCCTLNDPVCCKGTYSTYQPTSRPTLSPCYQGCEKKYYMETCSWFEKRNPEKTCLDDQTGNFRCCTNNRAHCCLNDESKFYITISAVSSVITLLCVLFHLKYKIIHREPEKIHIKIYPDV